MFDVCWNCVFDNLFIIILLRLDLKAQIYLWCQVLTSTHKKRGNYKDLEHEWINTNKWKTLIFVCSCDSNLRPPKHCVYIQVLLRDRPVTISLQLEWTSRRSRVPNSTWKCEPTWLLALWVNETKLLSWLMWAAGCTLSLWKVAFALSSPIRGFQLG